MRMSIQSISIVLDGRRGWRKWTFRARINSLVSCNSCRENYISGISILGGEPLDSLNQSGVRKIIEAFRNRYGESKTIWMWTGYEKDSIPITEHTNYILKELDAAVVGPFIKDLHDPELRYAGSTNQKIIKFKELLNS